MTGKEYLIGFCKLFSPQGKKFRKELCAISIFLDFIRILS